MIVLDTHVLIWWLSSPDKLSKKALRRIEKEEKSGEIVVSAISVWEIYMLTEKGRLAFTMETHSWIKQVERMPFVRFAPIDTKIAAASVKLPGVLHSDPADRIIIATALLFAAPLITSDKRILRYPHVATIW